MTVPLDGHRKIEAGHRIWARESTTHRGMPMYDYDLLVIGSGPGGQKAAIAAAKLGRSAAIVERTRGRA